MPGLINSTDGLMYGSGLNWLEGGLGDPGLVNPPSNSIVTTDDDTEITTG